MNYHFVWIVRRRKRVLTGSIKSRLEVLVDDIARNLDCEALNLAIEPEHIHLFMNCPPDIAPSQIMHRIKGAWSQVFKERVSLFDEATKYVDKGIFCFNCWQCS